jgi:hypothetical protein
MAKVHGSGMKCTGHKRYLLTCDEYDALWARAGGACEACGFVPDCRERHLVIDHDHKYGTSAVRGLICQWCNSALGRLETPDINPAFGSGPGKHFTSYLRRAWFVRRHEPGQQRTMLNRLRLSAELKIWRRWNKALSGRARDALVPVDKPVEAARLLREEMSPQAFHRLVQAVQAEAKTPKRLAGDLGEAA